MFLPPTSARDKAVGGGGGEGEKILCRRVAFSVLYPIGNMYSGQISTPLCSNWNSRLRTGGKRKEVETLSRPFTRDLLRSKGF